MQTDKSQITTARRSYTESDVRLSERIKRLWVVCGLYRMRRGYAIGANLNTYNEKRKLDLAASPNQANPIHIT